MFEAIAVGLLWWVIGGGLVFTILLKLVDEEDMPDWLGYTLVITCGPLPWLFVTMIALVAHNEGRWKSGQ